MKAILFKARHLHPEIDGLPAIFPEGVNPMNFAELDRIAEEFVCSCEDNYIDVYVTGLTSAVVAVIRAAIGYNKYLTLWHYDRESDCYKPQKVVMTRLFEYELDEFFPYADVPSNSN